MVGTSNQSVPEMASDMWGIHFLFFQWENDEPMDLDHF